MRILHRKQLPRAIDRGGPRRIASADAIEHRHRRLGVSGLHLGLFLRAHDVPVTIYADKEPDAIRAGKLLNTVAHHHHTLERERALGVDHWDVDEYGYVCHHHCIAGEVRFRGDFEHPSSAIDYRVYLRA